MLSASIKKQIKEELKYYWIAKFRNEKDALESIIENGYRGLEDLTDDELYDDYFYYCSPDEDEQLWIDAQAEYAVDEMINSSQK